MKTVKEKSYANDKVCDTSRETLLWAMVLIFITASILYFALEYKLQKKEIDSYSDSNHALHDFSFVKLPSIEHSASQVKNGPNKEYCNVRFAFCILYPSYLHIGSTSDNGDGGKFYDEHGLIFTVFAFHNAHDRTLDEEFKNARSASGKAYNAKGDNWFVLSDVKNSKITYQKTVLAGETFITLFFEYPESMASEYKDIVSEIPKNLRLY